MPTLLHHRTLRGPRYTCKHHVRLLSSRAKQDGMVEVGCTYESLASIVLGPQLLLALAKLASCGLALVDGELVVVCAVEVSDAAAIL